MSSTSSYFNIKDICLYCETYGNCDSQHLLLISPGNGSAAFYSSFAARLSSVYFVITFDRRGFHRSSSPATLQCIESKSRKQDILKSNAEDCASIIKIFSDHRPVDLFVTSGSTPIAFELVKSHPDLVSSVIVHEAIIPTRMPSSGYQDLQNLVVDVLKAFDEAGTQAANKILIPALSSKSDVMNLQKPHAARILSSLPAESKIYFQLELPAIMEYEVDLASLKQWNGQIFFAKGRDSSSAILFHSVDELAALLQAPLVTFPGGHTGYITHDQDFAQTLQDYVSHQKASKL